MFTEDYLMRIINQAIAALMTAIGLRKKGRYSEASQAIEQAIEQVTTLPAAVVDQMEDGGVLSMLASNGQLDIGRLAILADLYQEQGEILSRMNRTVQSTFAFSRALRFDLEVSLADVDGISKEYIVKIDSLVNKLKGSSLPVETQLALSDFYQRLLDMDDRSITAIGSSREKVNQSLTKLQAQLGSSPDITDR